MSLLFAGSFLIATALLGGTYLVSHGHVRQGLLYLAFMQIPGATYDVLTGQYGFLLTSMIALVMYYRGWKALA